MDNPPLVSIALPAFNAEKTVGDAVASILLQTYQNWELLFIDDGSSDQTVEIAKQFSDPRIQVFADGKNRGLPTRLNEAIDMASGKYFARMDNDDICFPERLEKQVAYLETHPEIDLLGSKALTFLTPWKLTGFYPFRRTHDEICHHPWNGFYLPHPTWMGKMGWFRMHRYHDVNRAEDQDLLLRSYSTSRFACLPEVLFAYRLRSEVSLRINRIARKSLLMTQGRVFTSRMQPKYLILSYLAYALKSLLDFYKSLIGDTPTQVDVDLSSFLQQWEKLKSSVAEIQTQK